MKKNLLTTLVLLNLVVVLLVSVQAGLARRASSVFEEIDLLVDVRHEILESYVEQPDHEQMVEAAVRAMVDALDDRYTVFLSPDELEPFDKQIRGSFSGIGAEIDIYEDRLRIVSPLEESPAWEAGVMAGDIVLEIEGESTEGIKITEAVNKLTGPEGTQVTIKVRHDSGEKQVITITRARINVRTVKGLKRASDHHWDFMFNQDQKIGYIRVTQFTTSTAEDVRMALDQLIEDGVRGLILDLRFNPGGLLESAVAVSDMFLDGGKRIVSIKGRSVPERVEMSTGDSTIAPIPVVVLANEASASASEIVTGALSDNGRAKFVGARTFGKGSVQQVKMLENGMGALKITNAYYYLPNGRNIHRRKDSEVWGVDPDEGFYVAMTPEQVKKMIEVRRESDILRAREANDEPINLTAEWIETELADPQLAAGLRALEGKLTDGDWPVVGQGGTEELVRRGKRESLVRQRDLIEERLEEIREELTKLDEETGSAGPVAVDQDEPTEMDTDISEVQDEVVGDPLSPTVVPAEDLDAPGPSRAPVSDPPLDDTPAPQTHPDDAPPDAPQGAPQQPEAPDPDLVPAGAGAEEDQP